MKSFSRVMAFVLTGLGVALILLGMAGCVDDPCETVWQNPSVGAESSPPPQPTAEVTE